MTDIPMPRLTDGMESGTIVAWLIEDGETVASGDELLEIETDKATMAWPSEVDGVLEIVSEVGATVAVGELIARIGDADPAPAAGSAETAQRSAVAPAGTADRASVDGASANDPDRTGAPVLATPLARRIAAVHGVELSALTGSGPGGRVTKRDVLEAAGVPVDPEHTVRYAAERGTSAAAASASSSSCSPPAPSSPSSALPSVPVPTGPETVPARGSRRQELTRLQAIVARRMLEATSTIPHFQVQTEVAVDAALALCAGLKQAVEPERAPSLNDLIVKACAIALGRHPLVNASFVEDASELHDAVHVGIAVATDEGLLVVTVRDADQISLGEISRRARELAERARAGTASPTELTGATFTVSNLGMFGMTAITPVINPPQAAILGVGAARPVLARDAGGEIVDRHALTLTLSGDHRILNGADGARFLTDVRAQLERPMGVLL